MRLFLSDYCGVPEGCAVRLLFPALPLFHAHLVWPFGLVAVYGHLSDRVAVGQTLQQPCECAATAFRTQFLQQIAL